jgi:hypothetical protein
VATDAKANPNTAQAQETLRRVMELLALENDLEAAVGPQAQALHAYPEAASAVERFHTMIKEHRDALRSYLDSRGEGAEPTASMVRVFVSDGPHPHVVSDILRNDYTAFTYAAISYAMLFELGLRLFDPDLRALAPSTCTHTRRRPRRSTNSSSARSPMSLPPQDWSAAASAQCAAWARAVASHWVPPR